MPGEDYQSWSTTAAANGSADALINWLEGMPRAAVNNSARSMMAAEAKNRDLLTGKITTAGTANAQTFTSGVGYGPSGPIPTGLLVKLKIGAALNNTGPVTLAMDGITAVGVLDMRGNALFGGELIAGGYSDFLYNGTNWILLNRLQSTEEVPQAGWFGIASSTGVLMAPRNGSRIKIQGIIYDIGGGVSATITNCYVNGVANQSLLPTTAYNCFVFNNNGVLTLDFSTSGHARDTLAGNVGVEVKSGDNSRSLVGKIYTTAGPQVGDSINNRNCISWFNRQNRACGMATAGAAASATSGFQNIDMTNIANFLTWGDDEVLFNLGGCVQCDTAGMIAYSNLSVDAGGASPLFGNNQGTAPFANSYLPISGTGVARLAEGHHYINVQGYVSAGTGYWYAGGTAEFHG